MKRINIMVFGLLLSLFICSSFPTAAQYEPEAYQAQKALKAQGYDPGIPDGLWGKATEKAIKHFQLDVELPITGLLDEQTKAKLGLASLNQRVTLDERRIALVIGNGNYRSSRLKNPVNDASDIADALERSGFEVDRKLNVPQEAMEDAIREFGTKLQEGTVGLFYYSGHGVQVSGRNYLIPIGARIVKEKDVKYKAVDLYQVLDEMGSARNGFNIVILDACRDNPLERSWRSKSQGLMRVEGPKGTLIAYSTAPGSVAEDGEGRNGTYTKHLLRAMDIRGLQVEQVFKEVLKAVDSETRGKQTPWMSSSFTGDFYFSRMSQPLANLTDERAKLERARQEIERLKQELDKGKLESGIKLREEEKKKDQIAKLTPEESIKPKQIVAIVARDGHYIKYDNGIVLDTKTGLEWIAGPDKNFTWDETKEWVDSIKVAGNGWRMPTMDELESLYQTRKGFRNMSPFFKTTGWFVWSAETKGSSSAWYFGFDGGFGAWYFRWHSDNARAFAVRSRPFAESQQPKEEPPKHASISPEVSQKKVIERDGQFIKYSTSVVKDTRRGLEWIAGPDKDTTWDEAKQWVDNLRVAGGGWRMPTIDELKTLYQNGRGSRNMTSLLKTTGGWVWSGETKSSFSARLFSFFDSGSSSANRLGSIDIGAFAVRSLLKKQTPSSGTRQQEKQGDPKETPKYASISPEVSKSKAIGRDGHFIAYSNGIIKDTKTGLEWIAGPDGDTNWHEAERWIKSLKVSGSGWRMPTMDELESLYLKGKGNRNMTPLLKTTGWWIWSGEIKDSSSARLFSFFDSGSSSANRLGSIDIGAFAVRSRR